MPGNLRGRFFIGIDRTIEDLQMEAQRRRRSGGCRDGGSAGIRVWPAGETERPASTAGVRTQKQGAGEAVAGKGALFECESDWSLIFSGGRNDGENGRVEPHRATIAAAA